jgi:sporulation protein YlmC with PRC-barrel domain
MNQLNLETRRAYADRADAEPAPGADQGSALIGATSLVGKDVCNRNGESLGELKEIVLDTRTGHVAYAVLSSGGFLSIGSKMFAVPWKALRLNTVSKVPLMDVEKGFLEHAPGFDADQWPDMEDPAWASGIHSYYGTHSGNQEPVPTP